MKQEAVQSLGISGDDTSVITVERRKNKFDRRCSIENRKFKYTKHIPERRQVMGDRRKNPPCRRVCEVK